MCPPPHRTVEQPQACSICRSFGAAPLHTQTTCRRCLDAAASTLHPNTSAAVTSMHLVSVSASHRRGAESLLDLSKLWGGSVANANNLSMPGFVLPRQALYTQMLRWQCRAHTLCLTPHRTVEQPQACSSCRSFGGSVANACYLWFLVAAASTLHPSASVADASCVRLRITPWSSRKLARSTGASWWQHSAPDLPELHCDSVANANHL